MHDWFPHIQARTVERELDETEAAAEDAGLVTESVPEDFYLGSSDYPRSS